MFSTYFKNFLPFSLKLRLSSAISLGLEESKIVRLGKGKKHGIEKKIQVTRICSSFNNFFLSLQTYAYHLSYVVSSVCRCFWYLATTFEICLLLTLSQTTNFKFPKSLRTTIFSLMKMSESSPRGQKTLSEKEELLVTSNVMSKILLFWLCFQKTCTADM